jgi:hypothetical protein
MQHVVFPPDITAMSAQKPILVSLEAILNTARILVLFSHKEAAINLLFRLHDLFNQFQCRAQR